MSYTYSEVKYDPASGNIEGVKHWGKGQNQNCRFSASASLFAINLAMDVKEKSIYRFMDMADGYGVPGFFPSGYDWSGIRDSSEEAIAAMYEYAKKVLELHDMELVALGLPGELVADITTPKSKARPS